MNIMVNARMMNSRIIIFNMYVHVYTLEKGRDANIYKHFIQVMYDFAQTS